MKDIFAPFASEIIRPLVMLAIPGAIGGAPWFVLIVYFNQRLKELARSNHSEAVAAFVVFALFAGLIFEDFGTGLESRWDEKKKQTSHMEDWHTYLTWAFRIEPVGH